MNNFKTLYSFEVKKILSKKSSWICFILALVLILCSIIFPLLGNTYVDGKLIDTNYNYYKENKEYAQALNGKTIDDKLLKETVEAYKKIPQNIDVHYTDTEEYQKYARPYSEIFNFVRQSTGMQLSDIVDWQPSEQDLYKKRSEFLSSQHDAMKLSDGEKEFWKQKESQVKKPFVYQEHSGYDQLLGMYQTGAIIGIVILTIFLSGLFADEHQRKTDQIILSTPLGKSKLYLVKIAAGISVSLISIIIICLVAFISTIFIYGSDGFSLPFQFMYTISSDTITCGQSVLIMLAVIIVTSFVLSSLVMFLSEFLRSSVASLAISFVFLLACMMINVPEQYRLLSQIYNWLPWNFVAPWNTFGSYTLNLFGNYFTASQIVPIIYIIAGLIFVFAGKRIYNRFQVSGR